MLTGFHFIYKLSSPRLFEGKAASSASSEVENICLSTTQVTMEVNVFINEFYNCRTYSGIYAGVGSKEDAGLQLAFQSV